MNHPSCCGQAPPKNQSIRSGIIYTCPMHPEIEQDHPGFCPICGMSLEPKSGSVAEDDVEYHAMLRRFWISCLLVIPVLLLAMGGFHVWVSRQFSQWVQLICTTLIVFGCGWPFFERAWYSFVHRSLNMFSLIAMGVGAAYGYSVIAVLLPQWFPESFKSQGELFLYFEVAAAITVLVLLGQVLELKAKSQTSRAISALLDQAAKTARLMDGDQELEIAVDLVKIGDILKVRPGDKIPVDGVIVEGFSYVDESMVSGEPVPVAKKIKDGVTGGTINQSGSFLMEAKHVGSDTLLARMVQMVSEAQRSKAPIQKLTDRIAGYFVPVVILIALATFVIWSLIGPEPRFAYALVNAIAVLIIACPCALGLATPMSIMVGVGRGAEMGVLIKNAEALEKLEKVNTVVMDKTGTLTEGKPQVTTIIALPSVSEDELLRAAAAVEKNSEHPLGVAIVEKAAAKKLTVPKVEHFISEAGGGVVGRVEGQEIIVGQPSFLREHQTVDFPSLEDQAQDFQKNAQTTIFVSIQGKAAGIIVVSDPIKPSTKQAIKDLHTMGIKVIMLTGDHQFTANAVAHALQIDEVYAEVNPKDKTQLIEKLRNENKIVAMAGDGINDSPALATADVGIAMGTGTDAAIESAEVTLVKGDLTGIVRAIILSRATMRNIRQNLFFAFIYNVLGVPIAAGLLYPFTGLLLNPIIAGAAMACSSLSVIVNALRLNRVEVKKAR
ncbi:MAG: copper-translocating P-type ATPase [Parachlamydia sp.]|nr:MAG: copper-translocating P-type ATPase [Parachlamydia sp.]